MGREKKNEFDVVDRGFFFVFVLEGKNRFTAPYDGAVVILLFCSSAMACQNKNV